MVGSISVRSFSEDLRRVRLCFGKPAAKPNLVLTPGERKWSEWSGWNSISAPSGLPILLMGLPILLRFSGVPCLSPCPPRPAASNCPMSGPAATPVSQCIPSASWLLLISAWILEASRRPPCMMSGSRSVQTDVPCEPCEPREDMFCFFSCRYERSSTISMANIIAKIARPTPSVV